MPIVPSRWACEEIPDIPAALTSLALWLVWLADPLTNRHFCENTASRLEYPKIATQITQIVIGNTFLVYVLSVDHCYIYMQVYSKVWQTVEQTTHDVLDYCDSISTLVCFVRDCCWLVIMFKTSKTSEYCYASEYCYCQQCYANVPDHLWDRNKRMKIWLRVNFLCKSSYFT